MVDDGGWEESILFITDTEICPGCEAYFVALEGADACDDCLNSDLRLLELGSQELFALEDQRGDT